MKLVSKDILLVGRVVSEEVLVGTKIPGGGGEGGQDRDYT